jgi:hypothetical protein
VLAGHLVGVLNAGQLGWATVWVSLLLLPLQVGAWAPALGGVYLGSILKRRSVNPEEESRPLAGTFAWTLAWGAVLGGVVFIVGFFGGLAMYRGSNLAPILGFLLGPPAFVVGLAAGALVLRIRHWSNRQMALVLAGAAVLVALALLGFMGATRTQDDSEVLTARIYKAAHRLSQSEQVEEIIRFQPPKQAGPYKILIGGAETPSWITEPHYNGLSVEYPQSPEGGPNWGQGRAGAVPNAGGHSRAVKVPVTLKIEKRAGELTDIVLRKRGGEIELVELR